MRYLVACGSREGYPRVRPVEAARGSCRAHARDAHAISGTTGRRPTASEPRPFGPKPGPASPSSGPTTTPPPSLRPGSALRRALDDALAEMDAGLDGALVRVEGALRAHARARARPLREASAPRLRHRAAPPPGGRARRDAHRADRRGREAERRTATAAANGSVAAEELVEEEEEDEDDIPVELDDDGEPDELPPPPHEDPGAERRYRFRHPTASGKTIAAAGFVEAARTEGVLILTHRRLLVDQFRRELTDHGYGERLTDVILTGQQDRAVEPDHDPDLRLVRPPRRRDLAHRLPARDLRRGAHRARREDLRRDPQPERADLHRHDGDRGADRQAGLRRLPRLGRRPAARRRRPPRADRAAPLPARPAGRGDQLGADRRRRLRGARPRRRPRPRGAEHGRRDPLPRAVRRHARDRLRGRRRPCLQPRDRVPRGRGQGRGGLGHARRR